MTLKLIYFSDEETLQKVLGLDHDALWTAGINLDDWDYGLIVEGKQKTKIEQDWDATKLLQGPCDNEWFQVKSKQGRWYTVGIAYHS